MASTAVKPAARSRVCGTGCATCRSLREAAVRLVTENGIEHVTSDDLADAVGLTTTQLALHRDGAAHTCIGDAYLEASSRLHDVWASRFVGHETWSGGLREAMSALLRALAEDEVSARLCFVEVPHGDREILRLREGVRRRNVEILCAEYEAHHPGEPVPEIHIELVCGTIVHAIAEAVANDRTAELVDRLDEIMAVAGQ
jgi:AcrR family transcriptional regulator